MAVNLALMVDEVKASLERMELLLRERYTQMIFNQFERTTETLRREIKTGFDSLAFAQGTTDLLTFSESLARFTSDLEAFTNIVGLQIQLNEFSHRLDAIEKHLSKISEAVGIAVSREANVED